MLDKFLAAAIPEPVVCLGVRLRPFSLGSKLILSRLASPFDLGGSAGLDDLMLAVLVCSQTYQENLDFLSGRDSTVEASLILWRKRLLGPWWKRRQFSFILASNLFSAYLRRANDPKGMPVTETDANKAASRSETPWELSSAIHCMRAGQMLEAVLDQPIALTRWIGAAYAESEGALTIVAPLPEKSAEEIALETIQFAKIREAHGSR